MPIYALGTLTPQLDPQSWVAPNAVIIGQVILEKNASVWWNVTIHGDRDLITIGENSNVQDGAVLHTDAGVRLTVGRYVTIAHSVTLHGCTIGDGSLIGIGATLLNNVVIGKNSMVGAGTLVPPGKVFPERSLILGSPGKLVRELSDEEVARLPGSAGRYVMNAQRYAKELREI